MVEVLIDLVPVQRLQKIRHRLKMLLPQRPKRRQQLRRRVIEVGQVLVASRKGNPVITWKGDASLGRRRFAVVVERDIRGAGSAAAAVERPSMNRRFVAAGLRNSIELFVGECGARHHGKRRVADNTPRSTHSQEAPVSCVKAPGVRNGTNTTSQWIRLKPSSRVANRWNC